LELIHIVCELRNEAWSVVERLNVEEFYQMLTLKRYINDKEKERIEKWRRKH
jgi:hypothetical protein